MRAETFLKQIRKIDVIIANRENDPYADTERTEVLKAKRQEIITAMENLTLHEYTVLYDIYVFGYMVKELPARYGRSKTWVGDTKRQALDHLQHILDKQRGVQSPEEPRGFAVSDFHGVG